MYPFQVVFPEIRAFLEVNVSQTCINTNEFAPHYNTSV